MMKWTTCLGRLFLGDSNSLYSLPLIPMKSLHTYLLATLLLSIPMLTHAHSGGIDSRGGHNCWTNCEAEGYYSGQYHFHPEKMNEKQLSQYESFKGRLCERVVRRFSDNEKMWQRVNDRVNRRFGFMCTQ